MLTVVNHLNVVSGASLTNPVAARLSVDLSRGLLEDLLDCWPCSSGASRHQRRAVASTLLTARDTRPNEEQALGLEFLGAANGVGIVGVTAVDDDVARLKVGLELLDEIVNSLASLHEENNLARALELGDELLDGVRALDVCTCDHLLRSASRRS